MKIIAVDGKTMPEARFRGQEGTEGAALHRAPSTVVTQQAVDAGSTEIPALKDLPAITDLTKAVTTAGRDARGGRPHKWNREHMVTSCCRSRSGSRTTAASRTTPTGYAT